MGWACAHRMGTQPGPAKTAGSAEPRADRTTLASDGEQRASVEPSSADLAAVRTTARTACPEGMVRLARAQGAYCIDAYEASLVHRQQGKLERWPGNRAVDGHASEVIATSEKGVKPQGYISGAQAEQACHNAGKRLCEIDEWVRACRGPNYTLYPYGNERKQDACNDRYQKLDRHPVVRLFEASAPAGTDPERMWYPSFMNDPRLHELPDSVAPAGAFEECTNTWGVYDMVGNLHEWVADEQGTFLGGFFMDTFQNGEGCEYRTRAHTFEYHDYSTGFRCCADPNPPPSGHG